jgi:hypothetical protein
MRRSTTRRRKAKGGSLQSDSDSDISDGLSSKVHKLEDALCSQDKLLCRVFCEDKDLNLKLENIFLKFLLSSRCIMT